MSEYDYSKGTRRVMSGVYGIPVARTSGPGFPRDELTDRDMERIGSAIGNVLMHTDLRDIKEIIIRWSKNGWFEDRRFQVMTDVILRWKGERKHTVFDLWLTFDGEKEDRDNGGQWNIQKIGKPRKVAV